MDIMSSDNQGEDECTRTAECRLGSGEVGCRCCGLGRYDLEGGSCVVVEVGGTTRMCQWSSNCCSLVSFSWKDKLCNVCGNIGCEEVLATCSRCSTACEHIYCMKVYNTKLPEKWICEACPKSPKTSDGTPDPDWNDNIFIPARTRKSCNDVVRRFNYKLPMAVRTSKVKFIPSEEAIRLTSEVTTSQRLAFGQNPTLSKSIVPISRKMSSVSSTVKPKFSPPKAKPYPGLFPSQPVRNGSIRNQKTTTCAVSKNSQGSNFQEAAKAGTANPEERDQLLEKLAFYRYYLPAKDSIWRGCVKVRSTTDHCEHCYEFRAQPPCKVHSKAVEFSKKMPPILQAKLLHREHIRVDLFKHDYPDLNDIALYFFPSSDIERARQKIANLAVLLESQKSVMICNMDSVELLIFTSKCLHVDSKDVLRMAKTPCLLWGLFRPVKGGGVTGRGVAVLQDSSTMQAGSSPPRSHKKTVAKISSLKKS